MICLAAAEKEFWTPNTWMGMRIRISGGCEGEGRGMTTDVDTKHVLEVFFRQVKERFHLGDASIRHPIFCQLTHQRTKRISPQPFRAPPRKSLNPSSLKDMEGMRVESYIVSNSPNSFTLLATIPSTSTYLPTSAIATVDLRPRAWISRQTSWAPASLEGTSLTQTS